MAPRPRSLVLPTWHPAPRLSHSIPAAVANDDDKDDDGVVHGPGTHQRYNEVSFRVLPSPSLHVEVHGPLVVPPPVQSQSTHCGTLAIVRFYVPVIFVMYRERIWGERV
ncbi:hypothetical protein B0H11DRAFT_2182666 [Mycena galericulata]|nr:hypothetical protein B0H11DRAFT_2182666 [Mycena galericulata]